MAPTKKCLVWDLDNTLWDGVCLEGQVRLRPEAAKALVVLDRRGILNSIASRGDADVAMPQVEAFGLARYFLVPKVNWLPKATNIIAIGRELGVGLDDVAFVDDDPFERAQVAVMLPSVLVLDAGCVTGICDAPEFTPPAVTSEARLRRQLYQSEEARRAAAAAATSRTAFLQSCAMRLVVRRMEDADVPRVAELMTRTHQLNTTGLVLSADAIAEASAAVEGDTDIAVADLTDRFGSYGTIGVAIARRTPGAWTLSYLALSCRVLGRGIERAFLVTLLADAARRGFRSARALYRGTGRNRRMLVLYQATGFRSDALDTDGETTVLRMPLDAVPRPPSWVTIA